MIVYVLFTNNIVALVNLFLEVEAVKVLKWFLMLLPSEGNITYSSAFVVGKSLSLLQKLRRSQQETKNFSIKDH